MRQFPFTLQWMKPKTRDVYVLHRSGGIQSRQLHAQFLGVIWLNARRAAGRVEPRQSFVTD